MTWAIISLVGLVLVIALSNWKKINVGVCGLAFAFVIGTLGGIKLKAIYGTVFFLINYFFFGWHKMAPMELSDRPKVKFERNNILTLLGFAAFIFLNLFFKIDLMITPICAAIVLMTLGVANPKDCMKASPFNTLMMLGGMSVYVGVIKGLGGVELLSGWITAIVTKHTAVSVFAVIAAVMSVFSSANSVVIPTLVAIIPTVTAMLPGVSGQSLLGVIAAASNGTAVSPMSTVGGNMLGYYSACYNPTEEQQQKVFNYFLIEAGLVLAIYIILPLFGVWNINIFH